MNQLKGTLQRRTSRTPTIQPDVRRILTSVCAPRPAAFHECLEMALSRLGAMHWEGVQEMVRVLHQELLSPEEALKILKPYLHNKRPAVVLKILTIVDAIVLNCGERFFEPLLANKWHTKITRLTAHADNKVKYAALQLISNYTQSYNGTAFGESFSEIAVSLTTTGFKLPTAVTPCIKYEKKPIDSAHVDDNFIQGIDFLDFQYPEVATPSANCSDEDPIHHMDNTSQTIQKIDLDVQKLMDAVAQCHTVSKAFKFGGCTRKEVLDSLNMAWIVSEKCQVWSENMQVFLTKELSQDDLTALLMTNDRLNDGLLGWKGLVSMDVINSAYSDCESASSSSEPCRRVRKQRVVVDGTIDRPPSLATALEKLRTENEDLRLTVSSIQQAQQTAQLNAEAEHANIVKVVKSKAASRIKDLQNQVLPSLREMRLSREVEDAYFKLQSVNQELHDKDQETGRLELEAADVREQLEHRMEEARESQAEMELRLQEKTTLVSDLEVQLANAQDELHSEKAAARAETANYRSQLDQLSRELERMNKEARKMRIAEYEDALENLKLELKRESILRKKAFNHIRELKGNTRVLARIRPSQSETHEFCLHMHDEYTIEHVTKPSSSAGLHRNMGDVVKRYEFDACFGPDTTQAEVYAETQHLIQSAMDGYNVCIFCYGQTGSGKTHTLTGSAQDPGIVPRFMEDVFNSDSNVERTTVSCYMLEIYQDDLVDLLSPSSRKAKMHIRTDADTGLVSVKGATQADVSNAAELKSTFDAGIRRRKTATTRCNISSSRSHLIFTVLLERKHVITGCQTTSKITFVDLAGSERVIKSGAVNDKERLNEAAAINKSLSALGDVVASLTARESFIPYRNHKLTELMRDSLGGNAKTLMIVNISPLQTDARETQSSLDYAQRAKQVTNETSRSYETKEIAKLRSVSEKQSREIQRLKELATKAS